MRHISARFVPRLLSDDQKAHRVCVCREQQDRDDPNFISNIITGDETWVYGYDPETERQSSQWKSPNSPRPKKGASSSQQCRVYVDRFFRHPRHRQQGIRTPWSNRQWQVLLWGFEAAEGGLSAQTSRQVEEKQLVFFSTMTTRPLTHHSFFDNSWLSKTLQWFTTPLFAWPRPLRLFPIPHDEITVERALFWHDWRDPRRIAESYRHTQISELPGMHEIMGNAGMPVYMPKGTTSKETVETRSYGKKLFLWSNSPDFGVAPRTCKLGTYSMLLWPCKKCSTNCYQWPISELLRFKRTV